MTDEELDQILRRIDEVIGPPEGESRDDRHRRLAARAWRRRVQAAARASVVW
jgi:hypothetical protein